MASFLNIISLSEFDFGLFAFETRTCFLIQMTETLSVCCSSIHSNTSFYDEMMHEMNHS